MINLNRSPYYEDFDPSKQYTQILAVAGRVEQAREFTQAQSILLDIIKKLSSALLSDGSIISGMDYYMGEGNITIQPGRVYINGVVHDFMGETLEMSKEGEEHIGVTLDTSIVTEVEDPTLGDTAINHINRLQPGAHRIKSVPRVHVNNEDAHTLYTFINGELQSKPIRPNIDLVIELLARRTYDESGNFKVHGLDLWAENKDSENITLVVEEGKAYVLGYEIVKPSAVRITVDKPVETQIVNNEPKIYSASTPKFYLNNNPVAEISKAVGTVQVSQSITRGGVAGGVDYLPNTPVASVVSVVQGGTTYVQGTHYQLSSNGIDWSLSGTEPGIGTTYTVVYQYNKTLVPDVDYSLQYEGVGDDIRFYIQFDSGDKPVEGSQMSIDYSFYLARIDIVAMDKEGAIQIIKGQPDILRRASAPVYTNMDTLKLGILIQRPNSIYPVAQGNAITRLNMSDLQQMVDRVKDMEYNQALTALDQEILNVESGLELKGIFSDGFASTLRADLGHPNFSALYDLESGQLGLPIEHVSISQPSINTEASNISTWGRIITAPFTEVLEISQPYATGTMLVNPYNVFTQMGTLKLNPAVDNWVDDEIIVEGSSTTTKTISATGSSRASSAMSDYSGLTWVNSSGGSVQLNGRNQTVTGTSSTTVSKVILDEAITFMRQRVVTISASNLVENSDNLELIFNGERVNLTPTGATQAGTFPGTVKSTSTGTVTATFIIPAGVRTGTRECTLRNDFNIASAPYTSQGRKRVTQKSVLITRVTLNVVDPLAQSFSFAKDKVLSSIGLYFSSKDDNKGVVVQVRNMVNGMPGQEIHAEESLSSSQVIISQNGSQETKISFSDPILCQAGNQYCVVILSDSDKYGMFIGELGQRDLATSKIVSKQPYNEGVLFSSSNAVTWTPHQTQDLKFNAYVANFASQGVLEFLPITGLTVDKISLLADQLTPSGTGCEWEFKIGEGSYNPITPYEEIELTTVASAITLRATFKSVIEVSPMLALDSFNLVGFKTGTQGSYISRNTVMSQVYTEVKQALEIELPSGCVVTPQFSYDGTTWINAILQGTDPVTETFVRYNYLTPVAVGNQATNFRARINITSPSATLRPRVRRFMNIIR